MSKAKIPSMGLIHDSRHVGFKLSCKLAMCYAGGQTLEKRQIAENRLVEILKITLLKVHFRI